MSATTDKRNAALVLVAALALLGASVAWAFGQGSDRGWGMSRSGPGMMGYASSGSGRPISDLADAERQAQRFADRLDLRVGEVMRFEKNYYAELLEPGGNRATEVLVNPATGAVFLEYGPAMMWNTRYGMMGGGYGDDPTWAPSPETRPRVSAREAKAAAARWLAREGSELRAGPADAFPGYYTLHVLEGDRLRGMLSVNAYTGAVWYHRWHGRFLSLTE